MVAMEHIGAMQFYGQDFPASYGFARQFAGPEGHVATLPEIISARAAQPPEHRIWNTYYTTASSEYFGISRGGTEIVIVAHGNGPLGSLAGIEEAYTPRTFRADGRPDSDAGLISAEQFRCLEDGGFGDVSIVDFAAVREVYFSDWFNFLTEYDVDMDPLLQARLGPSWEDVTEILSNATRESNFKYGRPVPRTIKSDGPIGYWDAQYREGLPYGQLLSVSGAAEFFAEREEFIGFVVKPHSRGDSQRFIGVRPLGNVADTHPGP